MGTTLSAYDLNICSDCRLVPYYCYYKLYTAYYTIAVYNYFASNAIRM